MYIKLTEQFNNPNFSNGVTVGYLRKDKTVKYLGRVYPGKPMFLNDDEEGQAVLRDNPTLVERIDPDSIKAVTESEPVEEHQTGQMNDDDSSKPRRGRGRKPQDQ